MRFFYIINRDGIFKIMFKNLTSDSKYMYIKQYYVLTSRFISEIL